MGGVITEFGVGVHVVYQSEDDRTQLETVLTAVVAWRRGRATVEGWRARLRRWRYRAGFGPLRRRFFIGHEAGLWSGSAGNNGEQATQFHPIRRVVRALGREYLLAPRGMTLVLLIDETNRSPTVRVMQIPAPRCALSAAQLDPESGPIRREAFTQEMETWRAALATHPEIAAFIGDSVSSA